MKYHLLNGRNQDLLKTFPDNYFDSIVTDPPYGIDFLGKSWDADTGTLETYQECLRVLKPGGHMLAFSAARTYHRLAITIEQAGFEIRDQIMWIYSSGFPKSQDVGRSIQRSLGVKKTIKRKKTDGYNINNQREFSETKAGYEEMKPIAVCTDPAAQQWEDWGTALKPAHEPIVLARKPIKTSIAKNCQTWGVGALNIAATRIPTDEPLHGSGKRNQDGTYTRHTGKEFGQGMMPQVDYDPDQGRFPSNVIGEIVDYQKYFYCPKVSRRERHVGFDDPGPLFSGPRFDVYMPTNGKTDPDKSMSAVEARGIKTHWQMAEEMGGSLVDHDGNPTRSGNKALIPGVGDIYTHSLSKAYEDWCKKNNKATPNVGNNHPTVKPVELMKYLIRLVTPTGGHVLDPFMGSGSTGMAAVELGHEFTGCELDPAYVAIADRRIQAWGKDRNNFDELFEEQK